MSSRRRERSSGSDQCRVHRWSCRCATWRETVIHQGHNAVCQPGNRPWKRSRILAGNPSMRRTAAFGGNHDLSRALRLMVNRGTLAAVENHANSFFCSPRNQAFRCEPTRIRPELSSSPKCRRGQFGVQSLRQPTTANLAGYTAHVRHAHKAADRGDVHYAPGAPRTHVPRRR